MTLTPTMRDRIVANLTAGLEPTRIEVDDDSDRHSGHAGARPGGGTHFTVRVTSPRFAGLGRVQRHRLVNDLLKAEFADGLHALGLRALAPGE